ncbi:hypothetical protein C8D88_10439 [Lentzea atacamensis]|uniref:Uncharacterized protein n=1 Tax=Lentzea atacamensis TaxID=531938 RepID=A0A316I327_9PSEU|nr:hypothetical protein C8D88_10439 [Lentzea atacamensis]
MPSAEREHVRQLREALTSRAVIDQAEDTATRFVADVVGAGNARFPEHVERQVSGSRLQVQGVDPSELRLRSSPDLRPPAEYRAQCFVGGFTGGRSSELGQKRSGQSSTEERSPDRAHRCTCHLPQVVENAKTGGQSPGYQAVAPLEMRRNTRKGQYRRGKGSNGVHPPLSKPSYYSFPKAGNRKQSIVRPPTRRSREGRADARPPDRRRPRFALISTVPCTGSPVTAVINRRVRLGGDGIDHDPACAELDL